MLALIGAVCTAPVVASYLAYYAMQPGGRTNFGALIEPQRPTPALALRALDGTSYAASGLRGKWVMLQVGDGACDAGCRRQLWILRQLRLTTGRERERVQRLWLVTDDAAIDPLLLREHEGTLVLRADAAELAGFLPLAAGAGAHDASAGPAARFDRLSDHIWLVDPLGNLMLRWPRDEDPQRMKRDLLRLLAASSIG